MRRLLFFLSLMREHLASYALGTALLAATLWMTFAVPRYVAEGIDILASAATVQDIDAFGEKVWLILIFAVAIVIVRTGSRLFFFVPGRRVEFDLKNRLMAHLCTLQRSYYLDNPSGAIISRLNNDINGVRLLLGAGLMRLLTSVGTLSLAPYYMYQISPQLTLYCALPLVVGFVVVQTALNAMRAKQVLQMAHLRRLSEFTVESFSGVDVLKAYRTYGWAEQRFAAMSEKIRDIAIYMSTIRAYCMPLLLHLTNALKMLLLLLAGAMVIRQQLSIGELSAYLLYLSLLVVPLVGMTFMLFILQRGFTSLGSLLEVFDSESGVLTPDPHAAVGATLQQGLQVRDLTFAYPDDVGSPVLQVINLDIGPGQVVGLFGAIGSGKSTLVNLINGYLLAPSGSVFLDGVDVLDLGQTALRGRVVTVAQNPFLFSETIRSNIALAIEDGDDPRIEVAARAAALNSDLQRMPDGLQTVVGEKGVTLSGGQKQRVALARALVEPRELVLLDDVLSAVDHDMERALVEEIYGFVSGRSTLLVSHRISALERADKIYVLIDGRIVDEGTHTQLIARAGPYQSAWALQQSTPASGEDA
jgi:ATP-binding cassette subfamily B protein